MAMVKMVKVKVVGQGHRVKLYDGVFSPLHYSSAVHLQLLDGDKSQCTPKTRNATI